MNTGLQKLGLGLGLVSIVVFFGALILAYWLRLSTQTNWVRFEIPHTLWVSTLLLAGASLMVESARFSLRRGRVSQYRSRLTWACGLGAAFLTGQVLAGWQLLAQGVKLEGNPHGSMFYLFAGAHGLHLLGGILALGWLLRRARRLDPEVENDLRHQRASTFSVAVYWHFMGVLWLCLLALLYRWS